MEVKLVSVTPNAEKLILYIARVSNPKNQNSGKTELIKYLLEQKHFSPFEHAFLTVEVKTSRAISAQIIRHRSLYFQEFSQRYSEVTEFEPIELRKQATKNRQSSTDVFDPVIKIDTRELTFTDEDDTIHNTYASEAIQEHLDNTRALYKALLDVGVARESARMILPLTTQTTIYISGTLRSFIHYIQLRTEEHAQKEHRDVAIAIKQIMKHEFPIVMQALEEIELKHVNDTLLLRLLLERGDLLEELLRKEIE